MEIEDMEMAVCNARLTLRNADKQVSEMARLITGRLRKCGVGWSALSELKKELKDFNIHTSTWKS